MSADKIYVMYCDNFYKIGVSKNPKNRMKDLQSGNPRPIFMSDIFDVESNAYELESRLHKEFIKKRIQGEWFELDRDDLDRLHEAVILHNNKYSWNGFNS